MGFGTNFFYTHILQHHLSFHCFTSWIKLILFTFLENYEPNQDFELSYD